MGCNRWLTHTEYFPQYFPQHDADILIGCSRCLTQTEYFPQDDSIRPHITLLVSIFQRLEAFWSSPLDRNTTLTKTENTGRFCGRNEENVLFNNALSTLLTVIRRKTWATLFDWHFLYAPFHRQDSTYNTSYGALVGTRNSTYNSLCSVGSPRGIDLKTIAPKASVLQRCFVVCIQCITSYLVYLRFSFKY